MIAHSRISTAMFITSLLLGCALPAAALAGNQAKSWELDVYDDGTDLTYVDDGYDDLTVYDHRYDRHDDRYLSDRDDYGYGYDDDRYYDDGRGGYCGDGYTVEYVDSGLPYHQQRYWYRGW